jgi:acetyl-CoA carboxylase biotin carboxyl carrier protein
MDIEKITELLKVLENSSISEIEIHEGKDWVRINRHTATTPIVTKVIGESVKTETPTTVHIPIESPTSAAQTTIIHGHIIKSPMVGTFYRAPSPSEPPFVEKGQYVDEGDTLCVIEAMKILNQVTAEKAGVVKDILVDNGAPVEYDQHLFIIG